MVPLTQVEMLKQHLRREVVSTDVMHLGGGVTFIGLVVTHTKNQLNLIHLVDMNTLTTIGEPSLQRSDIRVVYFGDEDALGEDLYGAIHLDIPWPSDDPFPRWDTLRVFLDDPQFIPWITPVGNPNYWEYLRTLITKVGLWSRMRFMVRESGSEVGSNTPYVSTLYKLIKELDEEIERLLNAYPYNLP